MAEQSIELPGLTVAVDRVEYQYGGPNIPAETPHVFIYFLTIANDSDRRAKLLGRKWVINHADGECTVVEGDKIVGEEPDLEPGDKFSYNSFHFAACDAVANGSFHGIDEFGMRIHTRIPPFEMNIPEKGYA